MTSTPDRFLLIVSRGNETLANYLEQHFKGDSTVRVVIDRRVSERRQPQRPTLASQDDTTPERRRNDRRSRPEVDTELRLTSFAIVTLPPEPGSPPAIKFV